MITPFGRMLDSLSLVPSVGPPQAVPIGSYETDPLVLFRAYYPIDPLSTAMRPSSRSRHTTQSDEDTDVLREALVTSVYKQLDEEKRAHARTKEQANRVQETVQDG